MSLRTLLTAGAATLALTAPSFAQTAATATTDLNYRGGPGPGFAVLGTIPADAEVSVDGCLEDGGWCKVTVDGTEGWAYGAYLSAVDDSMPLQAMEGMEQEPTTVTVSTVTYEPDTSDNEAALGLGATGAAAGFLLGGPLGALAGAAAGMIGGPITNPDGEVVTYITANPVDPIYAQGEVVVGARIPAEVSLYDVPDNADVRYANINNQTVLVEPTDRQIIYVVR